MTTRIITLLVMLGVAITPLTASAVATSVPLAAEFAAIAGELSSDPYAIQDHDMNGIPDVVEFALVEYILANDTLGAIHTAVYDSWIANNSAANNVVLRNLLTSLYGTPAGPYFADCLMAFQCFGDNKSLVLQALLNDNGLGALYVLPQSPATGVLAADADPDGDTNLNLAEWTAAGGNPATYVSNVLTAGPTALSITTQPVGGAVDTGGSLTLTVAASGGVSPYHYQWKQDGSNVGTDSASYSITSAVAGSAGSYTVDVTDSDSPATTVTSNAAVVTVNPPAALAITTQPAVAKTVFEGASFTLSVAAAGGVPPYTYQWMRGATNVGTNSASFTVAAMTAGDAGTYTCQVTDSNSPADSVTSNSSVITFVDASSVPAIGFVAMIAMLAVLGLVGVRKLRKQA